MVRYDISNMEISPLGAFRIQIDWHKFPTVEIIFQSVNTIRSVLFKYTISIFKIAIT